MKRLFEALKTLIFIYAILIGIEFFYGYRECDRLLLRLSISNNEQYVLEKGLGYELKKYNLTQDQLNEGAICSEFKVFGFRIGKSECIS